MKKIIMIIISLLAIISCNKTEDNNSITSLEYVTGFNKEDGLNSSFLINKNNPFDRYGLKMEQVYLELQETLKEPKNLNKDIYNDAINQIVKNNSKNLYPKLLISIYSDYESTILASLVSEMSIYNLKQVSLKYENMVFENIDLSKNEKNKLLQIISNLKFSLYYCNKHLNPNLKSWESEFVDCIRSSMTEVFADDGNPIPEIIFIANTPTSLLAIEAECAWFATFG